MWPEEKLRETENRHPLTPGTEKEIRRYGSACEPTDWAVTYLHGFSASRQESAPLAYLVADNLRAHCFHTRFSGHGLPAAELGRTTLADWLDDLREARAISHALGQRQLWIATSTGATLVLGFLAREPEWQPDILVLQSPNLGPTHVLSGIAYLPAARWWAPWILGRTWYWKTLNDLHRRYWTCPYPTVANFTMMESVRLAQHSELSRIHCPVLCFYCPHDEIVRADLILRHFQRLGSRRKELYAIENPGDPRKHILAGDILAPEGTAILHREIIRFVEGVCPSPPRHGLP